MTKYIYILFAIGILYSCGTKKNATPKNNSSETTARNVTSRQSLTLFHSALHYYQVLNYERALKDAQKYIEAEPQDDAGYFLLSKIQYLLQDSIASVESLEKAKLRDPNNRYYHVELANAYLGSNNYAKAEIEFKYLTDLVPQSSEYQFGYYRSLIGQKKYDKALVTLNKIESLQQPNSEVVIQRYLLYIEKKDASKAEKTLIDGLEEFPGESRILYALFDFYTQTKQQQKFLPILEKEITNAPENTDLELLLADFYLQNKNENKAMPILKEVFNDPEVDAQTKRYFFMDNVVKAENLSVKNATELAEIVIQHHGDDAFFHIFLGSVYDDDKLTDKALYHYKKGVKLAENKKDTYARITYLEYSKGLYDSLKVDAEKALELYPMNTNFYYFAGIANLRTGNYQTAIDILNEGSVYLTEPLDKADFNSLTAEAYFGLKSFKKGEEMYEKAIKETKDNTYLKVNYALTLAKNKTNLEKANQLIDEALLVNANNPNARYVKAMVAFQKGDYEVAKNILESLLKNITDDYALLNDLGDVYFKLGNTDEAVEFWKRATKLNPDNLELIEKKIADRQYYEK